MMLFFLSHSKMFLSFSFAKDVCLELSASLFLLEYKWRSFPPPYSLLLIWHLPAHPIYEVSPHKIDAAWKRDREYLRNVLFLAGRIQHEIHSLVAQFALPFSRTCANSLCLVLSCFLFTLPFLQRHYEDKNNNCGEVYVHSF